MAFKMKGPSMYPKYKTNGAGAKGDISLERSGNNAMTDGRANSSPFQMNEDKKPKKTKEDYIKEGFTPADADKMMKDGATTGRPKTKTKPKSQGDFEPAYPGADYSKAEIAKMTEKEKISKIDGYTPKKTKKTK
jgi:hypothetical protein